MNGLPTDQLLKRMFFARTAVLVAGAVFIGLESIPFFADQLFYLVPGMDYILGIATRITLLVIFAASPLVWYYTFRVGLNEAGPRYAIGHLLLCMALTPICLAGIFFIPLLVFYDVERWTESGDRATTPGSESP
jgi:hypothetical protein